MWILEQGKKFEGIPVPLMLLSQRPDPQEKQVINLDQDVHVCEYFCMYGVWTPFMNYLSLSVSLSLSFFLWTWAIFLSLSRLNTWTFMCPTLFLFYIYFGHSCVQHSFFFHLAFLSMAFISFCIAHVLYLEMITWREQS